MTLTFKLIRDIIKVNPSTKFWVRMSNSSTVRALTDRHSHGRDRFHTLTRKGKKDGTRNNWGHWFTCKYWSQSKLGMAVLTSFIRHFLGGNDSLSCWKRFGYQLPGIVLLHLGSAIVISTKCCLNALRWDVHSYGGSFPCNVTLSGCDTGLASDGHPGLRGTTGRTWLKSTANQLRFSPWEFLRPWWT